MNRHEKISFICDHDGTELSEAFDGLETFIKYVINENEELELMKLLDVIIDDSYEVIKSEVEQEQGLYWQDITALPTNCVFEDRLNNRFFKISDSYLRSDGSPAGAMDLEQTYRLVREIYV